MVQTGTSHYLGTNFSTMYDIKFQNQNNSLALPHYMSAGITTRIIGDIILVHGDDQGLVLPFLIAPTQIAILPIYFSDNPTNNKKITKVVQTLKTKTKKYRVKIDTSFNSFGVKINEQEISGTPLSIIVGIKDLENKSVTVYRRDIQKKITILMTNLSKELPVLIADYQKSMYNKALKHLESSIVEVKTLDEFKKAIANKKIVLAP
jgi:prolyl-tRNA synthetase